MRWRYGMREAERARSSLPGLVANCRFHRRHKPKGLPNRIRPELWSDHVADKGTRERVRLTLRDGQARSTNWPTQSRDNIPGCEHQTVRSLDAERHKPRMLY